MKFTYSRAAALFVIFLSCAIGQAVVVNVDFNAYELHTSSNRIGTPFTGQGAYADPGNDYWNGLTVQHRSGSGLLASDGTTLTGVSATIEGGNGFVDTGLTNYLLSDYFYGATTTAVAGLEPDTEYTLYVYAVGDTPGQGSVVTLGGISQGTTGSNVNHFVLGGNYVVFQTTADANGEIVIESTEKINGLQIIGVTPLDAVELTVGHEPRQQMKYGLDYERLWFWYGSSANKAQVAQWSVVDCDVDYLRVAINCAYELEEGVYDLSAYTDKIIPMMTAMKAANPNIKFFGSPRPLNEAIPNARWQPYPRWITGDNGSSFNFNWQKCAEYLVRYVQLMKSYGFTINYLDMSNEWNYVTPSDVRDIVNYLKGVLGADMPLVIAPSTWSFSQGVNWLNGVNSSSKRAAIDIVSSHNTGKQGTPQDFAAAGQALGKEVWDTEVHGWKGTEPADEIPTFNQWLDRIRAGFSGLDSWLAIGTTAQKHCYILNNGSSVTRNVKYYIFRKLSTTSNYGHALDINLPTNFTATAALIRGNLLTVWVLNNSSLTVPLTLDITGWSIVNPAVTRTRWNAALALEGVSDTITAASASQVRTTIEAHSLYCFELTVSAGNVRPVARDDNAFTPRNTLVIVNVLANDSDADGNSLSIHTFTEASNGSVRNFGNYRLIYVPNVNYTGTDSFSYTVTDGHGGTNTASVRVLVYPAGVEPYWTNLLASQEAFIRGGAYANDDQDEVGADYLLVKYSASNNDFSRKTYFQFDLSGLTISSSSQGELNLGFRNANHQNVQLWALNQGYPDFTTTVTWNTAQANELAGNNLLTSGAVTATPVGGITNLPASGTTPQSLAIPFVGNFVHDNRLTLALSGAPEDGIYANDSGGLRLLRTNTTLRVLVLPPVPPPVANPPVITSIAQNPGRSVRLTVLGEAKMIYYVQAATNLSGSPWLDISTNTADTDGAWFFTDPAMTNGPTRYYRVKRP